MRALLRRWPLGAAVGCVVGAVTFAACASAGESNSSAPDSDAAATTTAADDGSVAVAPSSAPTTVPVPTTAPQPTAVQLIDEGELPQVVVELAEEVGASVSSATPACGDDVAMVVVQANAELPGQCARFDPSGGLAVTSITALWARTPTACWSVDALVESFVERPGEIAVVQAGGVDHLGVLLASRDAEAVAEGAIRLALPPTPVDFDESGARLLLAATDLIDVGDPGWHPVMLDGGAGCASPTVAEALSGRYPLASRWQLIAAADAPAMGQVIEGLRPQWEAAATPAAPVDERYTRPEWLGTPLTELRPGTNYGVSQPTPAELVDRQLATVDIFPPPVDDAYAATIGPVPPEVVPRSTWSPRCPVALDDLSYLTMTFWGFDQRPHIGEMIVNDDIAEVTVEVFRQLYEMRFPIEDMSVMPSEFWTNPPTGDDNITSSFECRAAVGGSGGWSNHALGLAIDINPFHNVYRKGSLILPEYAEAYLDRDDVRPGMIVEGDEVVAIFDALGWGWGGRWSSADDPMHFSVNGR